MNLTMLPNNKQISVTHFNHLCVAVLFVGQLFFAGCSATRFAPGRAQVDSELQARFARGLGPTDVHDPQIPADVVLDDGVNPDEAVAVALWNNPAFNATLARLGMARGDLLQAGLLRNPQFQLFLPGGTKQLEWALFLPLDAMLLREKRLDFSQQEVCRVAEELVQNGLNLVRDTRVAHAQLAFAVDRAALGRETVELRRSIANLTQKQFEAGDISQLEATNALIALKQAEADAAGLNHAVAQAEAGLKQLMSISTMPINLFAVYENSPTLADHDLESLIAQATSSRPDLRAAAIAVQTAKKRADLSRWQWLRFDLVADANSGGAGNSNFGSGFRFDIPIFDRNQGGIQTADWTVYQAGQNYKSVRDQVVQDVQTSLSQHRQAAESLALMQTEVTASLDESLRLAEKAFQGGGASYFIVLQTTNQFLDARVRTLQLTMDLRIASANLDRSVGRSLVASPDNHILPLDEESAEVIPASLSSDEFAETTNNILILSKDGSALFSGAGDRRRVSAALRRIAARLDTTDSLRVEPDDPTSSKKGNVTARWQQ